MTGIASFFVGLLSLGAGAGMAFKERSKIERENREYVANRYSYAVQSEYDFNYGRLMRAYDMKKVEAAVKADYPRMTDTAAYKVAEAAVAKKLMESETNYRYKVSEDCKFFDLDKYVRDEFRIN